MNKLLFLLLILPVFSFGQNATGEENKTSIEDTSDFPYIRDRIQD